MSTIGAEIYALGAPEKRLNAAERTLGRLNGVTMLICANTSKNTEWSMQKYAGQQA